MKQIITVVLFSILSGQALGATLIKQRVDTVFGKVKYSSDHTWTIDKNKFTLDVTSNNGGSRYIFNGRTFYICSALNEGQIKFLAKNNIKDADLIEKFKKGACQTVPSNFMARFFLSPADAVESIDFSDGLKLSLGFEDYVISSGGSKKVAGKKCSILNRSYTLSKNEAATGKKIRTKSAGDLCQLKTVKWRKSFWREVSKIVLRQPGGGSKVITKLRKDYKMIQGFVLGSSSKLSTKGKDGKSYSALRTLSTSVIKDTRIRRKHFQIPKGYSVFSPENIELAGLKEDPKKSKKKKEEGDAASAVSSVFFCAISSGFGCFNF